MVYQVPGKLCRYVYTYMLGTGANFKLRPLQLEYLELVLKKARLSAISLSG